MESVSKIRRVAPPVVVAVAVALVAVSLLPVAPTADDDVTSSEAATSGSYVTGPDGRRYERNTWLLDRPRPDNTRVSSGSEPAILADQDGEWLWIADTSGGYRSNDGGDTWQIMSAPFLLTADGWSLAQDDNGDLYVATTEVSYISVFRSSNDGWDWELGSRIAGAAPIADRPWIAAEGDGNVSLFYYDWGRTFSETCARSTDGGVTWPEHRPFAGSPQAGGAAYDDAGNLYYVDDSGLLNQYTPGTLGATCFSDGAELDLFSGSHRPGAQHMLQVATDNGAVYSAAPSDDNSKVWLAGTRDLQSVRHLNVSKPVLKSNTFATVSARDGTVVVAWYGSETGGDPSSASFDGSWNVFLAVVQGFWTDSPNVSHYRLTDEANHVGDICMDGIGCGENQDRDLLDYFMVTQDVQGDAHVAYADDYDGGDTDSSEVYHAAIDV